MKKICPICKNEYQYVIADNVLIKHDNIWYFVCAKCEAEQKINTNRYVGKKETNKEMYEKIFVEPFKK